MGGSMGIRTHVVLPEELVQALNEVVGKGKKNHFIEQAIGDELSRKTLLSAFKMTTGVLCWISIEARPPSHISVSHPQ